ncbi:MAG TPA: DinB family protein [Blastocatellia bacterium]|nr:DinB family protein [Blastocatellia bacterium]
MRQLRELLARQLDWEDAHVGYSRAVSDFPVELRGVTPPGLAHSGWQLIEHLRQAQFDILDFCVNPGYVEPASMAEYWPANAAPLNDSEWATSVERFQGDLRSLKALALDDTLDLFAAIPHGTGQTYLRELLLVADHNAYHVGQLVAVRQALNCW